MHIPRTVNMDIDSTPYPYQIFNYKFAKKYISNKNVLDVGCWAGIFEKQAIGIVKKITGIDPDKAAIKYASKQIPKAKFLQGSAERIPFRAETFDTVVFLEVIEHVPQNHEKRVLAQINRVLKLNGYLVLSTPHNHLLSILFDPAFFLIQHRHYSISHLEHLMKDSGFVIKKIHLSGGWAFMITNNIDTIFKRIFKRTFTYPSWLTNRINREFENGFVQVHLIAQKKSM